MLHEERDAPLAVVEVGKHRARQELLPHRLPKALDLPARLRMMRAALHVRDAIALELLLEGGRSPPRRVLPPLVGEDFARRSVVGDATGERFHHERVSLVVRHHQAHHVTRVIVEEGRHVHALVPPQQEREEIRLPQLVGLGALEALRLWAWLRHALRLRARALGARLRLQHAAHRRLRGPEPEETPHHVTNTPAPGLRIRLLRGDHGRVSRIGRFALVQMARPARHRFDRRGSASSVAPRPLAHCRSRNAELSPNSSCRHSLVNNRRRRRDHHVLRPRRTRLPSVNRLAAVLPLLRSRSHPVRSFRASRLAQSEVRC